MREPPLLFSAPSLFDLTASHWFLCPRCLRLRRSMRANLNLWLADCILGSKGVSIFPFNLSVTDSPGRGTNAHGCRAYVCGPTSDVFTPATPPLVQSPASSIPSAASISSFDLDDGEWTTPAPNVVARGVYNAKAFEYVESTSPYTLV
jgi:hypothetical protein